MHTGVYMTLREIYRTNSVGVVLVKKLVFSRLVTTYPRIPSTPSKPSERLATPMDCAVIVSPEPKLTVSVNSVPEKSPEP